MGKKRDPKLARWLLGAFWTAFFAHLGWFSADLFGEIVARKLDDRNVKAWDPDGYGPVREDAIKVE